MMHQLLAILLMPVFVVGNSLAHSHSTATHRSASESRTHFHVGSAQEHGHHHHGSHQHVKHDHHGHDHHGHDHATDSPETTPVAPVEHDSDAVYIDVSDFVYTAFDRHPIEIEACPFFKTRSCLLTVFRPSMLRDRPPLATTSQLPIYLLHAALRL
jgi:hypothetical protein